MRTQFLVAEIFRPESDGKVTAIGLFPGEIVVFKKVPGVEHIKHLMVMVTVSDLKGPHEFEGRILMPDGSHLEPSGKPIVKSAIDIPKGMAHTILVDLSPFHVKAFGEYKFVFNLDGKPLEFSFTIRENLN